ncbi:MAG: hypothetical protein ACSW77_01575 [Bacteroidales bacterium]
MKKKYLSPTFTTLKLDPILLQESSVSVPVKNDDGELIPPEQADTRHGYDIWGEVDEYDW